MCATARPPGESLTPSRPGSVRVADSALAASRVTAVASASSGSRGPREARPGPHGSAVGAFDMVRREAPLEEPVHRVALARARGALALGPAHG